MKRLLQRIGLLLAILALVYTAVLLPPVRPHSLFTSSIDKHVRLASLPSPKLVIIGGSSAALSLDSQLIENVVHLPVINMGLNGGLGLNFMLSEVSDAVSAGDVIVITPEYEQWLGQLADGDLNLLWTLRCNPQAVKYINTPGQWRTAARYFVEFAQLKVMDLLKTGPDPLYRRDSFNDQGDFVRHLGLPPLRPMAGISDMSAKPFNSNAEAALRTFVAQANSRGATVIFAFPSLARSQYDHKNNRTVINDLAQHAGDGLGLIVAGKPEDAVYSDDLFYDTVYHLSDEGRRQHSEALAKKIKIILDQKSGG